jgi:hypothetical protein
VRRWGIRFVVGSKKPSSIAFRNNSNMLRVYRCVTGPDASRPGPPSHIPTRWWGPPVETVSTHSVARHHTHLWGRGRTEVFR